MNPNIQRKTVPNLIQQKQLEKILYCAIVFIPMILIPGKIPIIIHPLFWVLSVLIGVFNSSSWIGILVWVGVILVSVLVHEFGHALTAVAFRQKARIQLMALGGVTSYEGPKLSFAKQFFIVFNGPLFGFLLFVLATVLLRYVTPASPILFAFVKIMQVANLFWSVVNLLPVLPLDGGQLLRIALEARFGIKGFRASLLTGAIFAVLLAFYFFLIQAFLVGAIFFLFAYQSFDSWRKSRIVNAQDRSEENKDLLMKAEMALQEGRHEEAKGFLTALLQKTKGGGLLSTQAAQYLALLFAKEGKLQEAYDLLLPIHKHLNDELLCLLHKLAFTHKNYALVAEISSACYQAMPTQDVALRNARSFAVLHNPKLAGGWVQAAWQCGALNLPSLLQEPPFQALLQEREFREFIERLQNGS